MQSEPEPFDEEQLQATGDSDSSDSYTQSVASSMDVENAIKKAEKSLQDSDNVLNTSQNGFLGFSDVEASRNKKETSQTKCSNFSEGSSNRNRLHGNKTNISSQILPECTRFMYIQPTDVNVSLKKFNPFGLKKSLEVIAGGSIKSAKFCRTGSLLVETSSFDQSKKIFSAKK